MFNLRFVPMAHAAQAEHQRDPERTRAEILEVATREFAENGYSGARVDEIAEQTRTTKRMLYYYFASKEGLYTEVLERAYSDIRAAEQSVDVEHLDPDFIRLVSIENIHRAEHMRASGRFADLNMPAIDRIARILERGRAEGTFTRDADAVDVHMLISAYCVFRIANRHTWETLFNRDLLDPETREHHRTMLGDIVVDYLTG
jgi:AcrR family transcriptional regulator